MPAHPTKVLAALIAIAGAVSAQVVPGDIGVTGFSTNAFGVVTGAGVTGYNVGSFQGSSAATSQAILWDPAVPASFIVGGFGFVGRATITAPGAATYAPINLTAGTEAAQMSFDASGNILVADAGLDQVRIINPATGAASSLTAGAQPWSTSLNAGAYNPVTGDFWAGNNGSLFRVPAGTSTGVLVTNGFSGAFLSGVAFDPITNETVVTTISSARFARVSASGVITDIITPASVATPNAVDVDANGDWILGSTLGRVYRVPYAGGTPVLIGTNTSPSSNVSGVSVVRPTTFRMFVVPNQGGGTVSIFGIPAGTIEGWTVLSLDTSLPVGTGPILGMVPDALSFLILNSFPVATPGGPFHWTWGAPPPAAFPNGPFVIPPGTISLNTVVDFIALAFDANFTLSWTPPVRVNF